ncbi:hypothetical protein AMECASPLE_032057 [Ameca splendens]|uniref:Amino acid transporter n=1 Tax=Ameca splendens TaxID=208324 RepID=A0ABV1ACW3_9TELE
MLAREIKYLHFPGEMLLRMLQMMVLPLIVSSLIAGMSNVDKKVFGKTGLRAFIYYIVTTVVAAGCAECGFILNLIRNLFPSNLVEACFRQYVTVYPSSNSSGNRVAIINMTGNRESFLFQITNARNCRWHQHCRYSPVGIIFLLAGQVVKMTDAADIGRDVAMYTLTVITGFVIHGCVTLPLIYFIVTRKNPLRFYGGILQALSTAFGTSSSSATLPVTLHCMEENHDMDKQSGCHSSKHW